MRVVWTSASVEWLARRLAVFAIVFALACSLAWSNAATAQGSVAAKVLGVRFGGDGGTTRIVIESDRPVSSQLSVAQDDPRHLAVLLGRTAPLTHGPTAQLNGGGFGFVRGWRMETGVHGSRLVITFTGDCQVAHRFALEPIGAATSYRYVIDIAPVSPRPTRADSGSAPAPFVRSGRGQVRRPPLSSQTVSSRPAPLARHGRKVIVVDAGHGGHDPGAQAASLDEKDITLATALTLRKRLERSGRYRVVMTRDSDVFIPLPVRVQIARRAGADLFISLHADSAGGDPDTHGASVYTLSDHGETRVTEVLGQSEWFTRPGDRRADPAVGRILLDLTQRSTLNRSALFAGLLIDRVSDRIDLLPRTHRDAGYFVLLAPDVPAVLLEMGFISSPRDQGRLNDPAERAKLTDAIAGAIDAYFDGQTDTGPAPRKAKAVVQDHAITSPIQSRDVQSG